MYFQNIYLSCIWSCCGGLGYATSCTVYDLKAE